MLTMPSISTTYKPTAPSTRSAASEYTKKEYKPQRGFNLLAPDLFFLILAHSVYKMWIIQEPNMLDLLNKLHFEEEKTDSIYHV